MARRQLKADFKKAAAEAVDFVSRLVLVSELADAVRFLRDADRAIQEKNWELTILRLDDAASAIARFSENYKLGIEEAKVYTGHVVTIRSLLKATREHQRSPANRGHLPLEKAEVIGDMLNALEKSRGRLFVTHAQ